jgi:hypothetical protein
MDKWITTHIFKRVFVFEKVSLAEGVLLLMSDLTHSRVIRNVTLSSPSISPLIPQSEEFFSV